MSVGSPVRSKMHAPWAWKKFQEVFKVQSQEIVKNAEVSTLFSLQYEGWVLHNWYVFIYSSEEGGSKAEK